MKSLIVERDLEGRIAAVRQQLTALEIALRQLGQHLDGLTEALQSRRQVDNVVGFELPPRRRTRSEQDLLLDFLE